MITGKMLKEMAALIPDNARIHAYEGEDVGMTIWMPDGSYQWIRATSDEAIDDQEEFTLQKEDVK